MRPLIRPVLEHDPDPGFSMRDAVAELGEELGGGLPEWFPPPAEGFELGPQATGCLPEWEWRVGRRDGGGASTPRRPGSVSAPWAIVSAWRRRSWPRWGCRGRLQSEHLLWTCCQGAAATQHGLGLPASCRRILPSRRPTAHGGGADEAVRVALRPGGVAGDRRGSSGQRRGLHLRDPQLL